MDGRARWPNGTMLGRVRWITTDGSGRGNNLSVACSLLSKMHVSCIAHIFQSTMRESAERDEVLMRALVLARSVAGKLRKNTMVRHNIARLVGFAPTRFDSMLGCLRSVIKHLGDLLAVKPSLSKETAKDLELLKTIGETKALKFRLAMLNYFFGLSDHLSATKGESMAVLVVQVIGSLFIRIGKLQTISANDPETHDLELSRSLLEIMMRRLEPLRAPSSPFSVAVFFGTQPRTAERYFRDKFAAGAARNTLVATVNSTGFEQPLAIYDRESSWSAVEHFDDDNLHRTNSVAERWLTMAQGSFNLSVLASWRDIFRPAYDQARRYVAIAPAEVSLERLFSRAVLIVSERLTAMKDELINAQLLLKLYNVTQ